MAPVSSSAVDVSEMATRGRGKRRTISWRASASDRNAEIGPFSSCTTSESDRVVENRSRMKIVRPFRRQDETKVIFGSSFMRGNKLPDCHFRQECDLLHRVMHVTRPLAQRHHFSTPLFQHCFQWEKT